ncbi:acyltransferase family protein [Massilia sp. LXY-6]|uniref:acyltransferase family protein n=1 Tax=Massilia sp. LXY-6 TaxID=3379823 RepID=UPI003EE15FC4
MTASSPRFHELDFLRGIACISVLAFHFLSRGPSHQLMPGVHFPLVEAFARYGYLGVHLFFVLSGFVIMMSAEGAAPRAFLASRASRLYPGLWAAASLTAGAAWLLSDSRFLVSSNDYLVNLTMIPQWFGVPYVDGAYWSLGCEVQFYILVWLVIRLGLLPRLEQLMAAWLLVSTVNAVRPMWPVEFWLNAKWAPFFVAGSVFYLVRRHGSTPFRLALLAAAFVLAQYYTVWDRPPEGAAAAPLSTLAVRAVVVTVIFALFWLVATGRFRMRASPFVYYAGALTYPLYLIHQNLGFMVYERLHRASGMVIVPLVLTVALLLATSWCIHAGVERQLGGRMRRWLARPQRDAALPAQPSHPLS